jgi:uncharacterized OsmC-like protein
MTAQGDVRVYAARGASTTTFGRVLCSARDQHFVADGPPQNGCPGEAASPAEYFLAGVASCGVELVQVLAREHNLPLSTVEVVIEGRVDRAAPVRPDVTLFNEVSVGFTLGGLSEEQAQDLVARFRRR